MAKRRKSSRRERIPVIDTLLDLAQAATLDYVAYKHREKRKAKSSGKIDPYAATGMAMGMGIINDTEDLLRFGGMLGAMGAFDPDEPDEVYRNSYTGSHEDNAFYKPKNNKYAWRLNCEDGSKYGISPEDYETRSEYHNALHQKKEEMGYFDVVDEPRAKISDEGKADDDQNKHEGYEVFDKDSQESEARSSPVIVAKINPYENDDFHVYFYCKVNVEGYDEAQYYRTEDSSIKKGSSVLVPDPNSGNEVSGIVVSVERHMNFSVPKPLDETNGIIGKTT